MFESVFSWLVKKVDSSQNLVNLSKGEVTDAFVDNTLKSLGNSLAGLTIDGVSDPFVDVNHIPYLSKTKTVEVMQKFGRISKEELVQLPNEFQDYRDPAIDVINKTLDLLREYDLCFDKFINQKKILIFSKNIGYTEVWTVRKKMKEVLLKIQKLLEAYDPKKYTYETFVKKLIPELEDLEVDSPKLVDKLADKIREDADAYIDQLPRYQNDPSTVDESKLSPEQSARFSDRKPLSTYKAAYGAEKVKHQKAREKKARELLAQISDGAIKVGNAALRPPLVGDVLFKFKGAVDYTLEQLDDVIFLGDKAAAFNPDLPMRSRKTIGVDMKTLLGSDYETLIKTSLGKSPKNKFLKLIGKSNIALFEGKTAVEERISAFNTGLKDDMLKSIKKTYKSVEKAWDKIQSAKKKAKSSDTESLVVKMPSNSKKTEGKEEKDIDINKRYKELTKHYTEYLTSPDDVDRGALYIRKGEKFILACELWLKKLKEEQNNMKRETKRREKLAKEWIDRAKKYYKSLDKQAKAAKKVVFDALPKKAQDFVQQYNENVDAVSKFMEDEEEPNDN